MMKTITALLTFFFLCSLPCQAAEIKEAFGYILGDKLSSEDIINKRTGIGPHDVIAKKKARTVKIVQAYTSEDNRIFTIDGINTFTTMDQCSRMATAISFFLEKKFADVIDEKTIIKEETTEQGVLFSDKDGGKAVTVTCTLKNAEASLSVRYTDVRLAEQALKSMKAPHAQKISSKGP